MPNKNTISKISNPPNQKGGRVEYHIPQSGIHQITDYQIHIISTLLKLYFCQFFDPFLMWSLVGAGYIV